MKNIKSVSIFLIFSFVMFIGACGSVFDAAHHGDVSKEDISNAGTLSIAIPALSGRLASLLSTMTLDFSPRSPGSRAFLFASRAELELRDSLGVLIDSWTSEASTELWSSTTEDTSRTVPSGSGYSLSVRVFNDKVSLTEPVVMGEVTDIAVVPGEITTVTMPCIPNTDLFNTTLVAGTPATGSLECADLSEADLYAALVEVGSEAWFKIVPAEGNNRIDLLFSSGAEGVGGYISLFRSDGTWMNRDTSFMPQETASIGAAVSDSDYYYVGIALASLGTPDSADYSLTLAESSDTGINLVTNGDFSSGESPWALATSGSGSATMSVVDAVSPAGNKELKIHIASGGAMMSDLFLYQRDITVNPDSMYRLGFKSRVSTDRTEVWLSLGDYGGALGLGDPAGSMTSYGGILDTIRTNSSYLESTFFVSGPATTNAYLLLQLFDDNVSGIDLFLDDISLEEIEPLFTAPANFTATPSGRSVAMTWEAVPGATEYVVTRRAPRSGPFHQEMYVGSALSFTDTNTHSDNRLMIYGEEYEYRVTARSAFGMGTPAVQLVTLASKPVSGSIENTGLSTGDYPLVIVDPATNNRMMTGTVTLDANGAGSFSIAGGEQTSDGTQVWFIAYLDLATGPEKTYYLGPGDLVSCPISFTYDTDLDDGTITDMKLWDWNTAGSLPILANTGRLGPAGTASLSWWDVWNRDYAEIMIQRSDAVDGTFATITKTDPSYGIASSSSVAFAFRSCTDTTATTGTRWYYRIGVDANLNGTLDPGEYETETNTSDVVAKGTLNVTFE